MLWSERIVMGKHHTKLWIICDWISICIILDFLHMGSPRNTLIMPWSHLCVKPPRMSHYSQFRDLGWYVVHSWQIRIYVAVRGSYGALTGSMWRLLPRKISPIYCRVSYVALTKIHSLVLRNMWHYVIIRYSYGELPKFDLHCSYKAALRKGGTMA